MISYCGVVEACAGVAAREMPKKKLVVTQDGNPKLDGKIDN
jgi:hypothetical protein